MFEKLKWWMANDTIFGAILLVLVGISSFGLGRLSVLNTADVPLAGPRVQLIASSTPPTPLVSSSSPEKAAVVRQSAAALESVTPLLVVPAGPYVASKSGTKYHLVTCPGAKQIKPANKIFFATAAEAAAAGYSPASNCPGL